MIPKIETCFLLMEQYSMLSNIKDHSLTVAKAAHLIARKMNALGIEISIPKVTAGALLHDIGKTACLKSGEDHAEMGKQICIENNLHEIYPLVAEHVRLKNYRLNSGYSEKEIVFYSDKRVNHDKIVSVDDRLAYILERYGKNQKQIRDGIKKNFELCLQVEKKLFKKLNFHPSHLSTLAKNEDIYYDPSL